MRSDISANVLKSISVASFSLISHVFQNGDDSVAEVSLDGDFSVFYTTTYSAFDLQCASQISEVIRCADEAGHKGDLLSCATFSVDCDDEVLL